MSLRVLVKDLRLLAVAVVPLLVLAAAPVPRAEAAEGGARPVPGPLLKQETVFQSSPDECFQTIGGPRPAPPCPAGFQPRWNQQYAWGGTRAGDFFYFGTGPNNDCWFPGSAFSLARNFAYQTKDNVCEMGQGPPAVVQRLGAQNGDVRPPHIYQLNSRTNAVKDVTPTTPEVVDFLNFSVGVRMAATHDDVVMLGSLQPDPADPTNPEGRAVQFIALEGSTGRYLGLSQRYVGWSDIREGIEANGELYIGVRGPIGPQTVGGLVLKWHGDKTNPFGCPAGAPAECVNGFETVGKLDTEPAFFTIHDGRLAINSWAISGPGTEFGPTTIHGPAGTYLSPKLPKTGGLTAADADPSNWPMIFNWGQYDPDPLIQDASWMGDIVSWRGRLFLGTYVSGGAQQLGRLWNAVGRPSSDLDKLRDMNAANKPVHLFEIENAGQRNQKVALLYGEAQLPVFQGGSGAGRWAMRPNKLGQAPKFGPAGFIRGNIGAGYQWNWTVMGDRLYMSTSDITNPATLAPMMKVAFDLQPETAQFLDVFMRLHFALYGGADMWRMDSPDRPAVAETVHGYAGDRYIWGCRAFAVFADKGFFYCGTALQYNLRKGFDIVKFTPQRRPVGPPIEPPFSGDPPDIQPPVGVIG